MFFALIDTHDYNHNLSVPMRTQYLCSYCMIVAHACDAATVSLVFFNDWAETCENS